MKLHPRSCGTGATLLVGLAFASCGLLQTTASKLHDTKPEEQVPAYNTEGEWREELVENFPHKRFAVDSPEHGRLVLVARDGFDASEILEALKEWTSSRGEDPVGSARPVVTEVSLVPTYALDVSNLAPKIARDLNFLFPEDGPNCWVLTAATAGATSSFRMFENKEFARFASGAGVKRITSAGDLKPGDIVAIRQKEEEGTISEVHGATYIHKDLFWTKNGAAENIAFRLMDSHEVFGKYMNRNQTDPNPHMEKWKCTLPTSREDDDCEVFVDYLRIEPLRKSLPIEFQADAKRLGQFSHELKLYGTTTEFYTAEEKDQLLSEVPDYSDQFRAASVLRRSLHEQARRLLDDSRDTLSAKEQKSLEILRNETRDVSLPGG